jgi:hypothetical protein
VSRTRILNKGSGPARRKRRKEPLDVELTVRMNFGNRPSDAMTLVKNRRVPLVGSVFENRDRIAKGFLRLLLKASASQPKVIGSLLPARLLQRR